MGWDYPGTDDPYDDYDDEHFPPEDDPDFEDDLVDDHERGEHDNEPNPDCPICIDEADDTNKDNTQPKGDAHG